MNADAGAFLFELHRQRRQDEPCVVVAGLNAQCAEWSGLNVSLLRDVIVYVREHLEAALKKALASICESKTMSRTIDEAETQRPLQFLDPLADDGWPRP